MQIEQAFTLQAPRDLVWQGFHDIDLLVGCLPGASIDPAAPATADGNVALLFKVKLGLIAAQFKGRGQVVHDEAAHAGSFAGSAVDAKTNSRIKGEARFVVTPDPTEATEATHVAVTIDFTITGSLAQFSREGIVRALADTLSRQFADNLQWRLQQAAPTDAAAAAGAAGPLAAMPDRPAANIESPLPTIGYAAPLPDTAAHLYAANGPNDSALDLWQLIKAWLRGLLRSRESPK